MDPALRSSFFAIEEESASLYVIGFDVKADGLFVTRMERELLLEGGEWATTFVEEPVAEDRSSFDFPTASKLGDIESASFACLGKSSCGGKEGSDFL